MIDSSEVMLRQVAEEQKENLTCDKVTGFCSYKQSKRSPVFSKKIAFTGVGQKLASRNNVQQRRETIKAHDDNCYTRAIQI